MPIKSTLIHYNTLASVANLKFSANAGNTRYTLGPEGTQQYIGTPDIPFDKLVFIKDAKMDWTHGQARRFMSMSDFNQAIAQANAQLVREANAYTDQKVEAMAAAMGIVQVLTTAEYLALRDNGQTEKKFYAIYKNAQLYRIYFDDTLFAKKAESDDVVSACVFPLIFPIIFA